MGPREDIEQLFHPRGVALVGPVDRDGDPARVLAALVQRWGDAFHLVDRGGGTIGDRPIFAAVGEVPDPVDLAVLSVATDDVVEAARACGERGIRFLIVSASGFAELGDAGAALEAELISVARAHGMRVLGPNANANCFDAMPPAVSPAIGLIGLITQSGHMGRVIFQSSPHGVAFSRWVPTGNEADLEAADFIEYMAYEKDTAVIAGYFEGFRDDAKLRRALAAAASQQTPVVVIKVGRHDAASRMAASHTAHLTGSDAITDGLFKQYGVIRVDDVDELIETAALHAKLRRTNGERVALYGISGGALALMADHAQAAGVQVPVLSPETQRRLHEVLPAYLGVANPVDNGNLYRTGTQEERRAIFRIIAADPSVDVLVCALTGLLPGITDDYAADILDFAAESETPVVVTWNTWAMDSPAYTALVRSGIPIFRSFRGCFAALSGYFDHQRRSAAARARGAPVPRASLAGGPTRLLDSAEGSALLRRHGIPLVEERPVASAASAAAAAAELGFPVVLKAPLADVPHKSDAGLVLTDIRSRAEAAAAFDTLLARAAELAPTVSDPPVIVQRQVRGTEMIVGITCDPLFGSAILVGLGGVFTEVTRDVSVRPLPVTRADVDEMLRELRAYPVLEGVRGEPAADLAALIEVVQAVAALAGEPAHRIVELDLNPVIATSAGVVDVDHLIVVE
jgi:acyl-CoA synthetase (NDP forming)